MLTGSPPHTPDPSPDSRGAGTGSIGSPPHTPDPSPTLKGGEGRPHPLAAIRSRAQSRALRLVRCQAGGESYCLDPARVVAIERVDGLEPNAELGMAGAGDPGGQPLGWIPGPRGPLAVFSLAARLGASLLPSRGVGPVIIVDAGSEP